MNRTRLIIISFLALSASGLVTFLAYRMLSRRLNPTSEDMTEIVVAAEKLSLGTRLTKSQLRMALWPEAVSLEGSFFDMEDAIGRGVVVPMLPNEPVMESKLAAIEAGAGLATAIPEGMRAVAIKVNDVIGIAGFVLPATRVDVIVTGSPERGRRTDTSQVILENIEVLAAGQNVEQDVDGTPQNVQVITLLVTPQGAEKLALAAVDGRLQLALRHPLDLVHTNPEPVRKADLYRRESTPSPTVRPVARPRARARKPTVVPAKPRVPRLLEVELIQGSAREIIQFEVIP